MLAQYTVVKLATDNHAVEGAHRGMVGTIIEVYADGHYEIELCDADGITIAQIVAAEPELAARIGLGTYGCVARGHDNDPYDDGQYVIELRLDGERVTFDESYESRSNHGYNLVRERGFVIDSYASPVVVELVERTSSGYEDTSNEARDSSTIERVHVTLERLGPRTVRYGRRVYEAEAIE